jgi:hypothetical protein
MFGFNRTIIRPNTKTQYWYTQRVCSLWDPILFMVTGNYMEKGTDMHTCTLWDPIVCIYRVSQEECARLRECVPYVKLYRYNPKHLCPKLNGYGDYGQRNVWASGVST